jgi:hypothetical protein
MLGLCVMTGMGDVRPGTESKKNKEASNEQSGTQPGKLRTWRFRKKSENTLSAQRHSGHEPPRHVHPSALIHILVRACALERTEPLDEDFGDGG